MLADEHVSPTSPEDSRRRSGEQERAEEPSGLVGDKTETAYTEGASGSQAAREVQETRHAGDAALYTGVVAEEGIGGHGESQSMTGKAPPVTAETAPESSRTRRVGFHDEIMFDIIEPDPSAIFQPLESGLEADDDDNQSVAAVSCYPRIPDRYRAENPFDVTSV